MRRNEAISELSRYFTKERTTIWRMDVCDHIEVSITPCCEECGGFHLRNI